MTRRLARLGVVVPAYGDPRALARCLDALRPAAAAGARVVVVGDGPGEVGRVPLTHSFARVREHAAPRGFGAACHTGVAALGRREYVALVHADAAPGAEALARLVAFLDASPGHAGAAPRLVSEGGAPRPAGRSHPRVVAGRHAAGKPLPPARADVDVEVPDTATLVLRRDDWDALGGLDPRLRVFFADADLGARLAARGRRVRVLADVQVAHEGGASIARLDDMAGAWHADRLTFVRRHHGRLAGSVLKGGVVWSSLARSPRPGARRLLDFVRS